jgi:ABC-2 type transport system ATP-binding protein
MTVLVTTAYLDEAERCNRVGFMYKGRLIACDSPQGIVSGLEEECYEVSTSNHRKVRERLSAEPGVLSVEPSGSSLHLFLSPGSASVSELIQLLDREGLGPAEFREMRPSLEDVFIALVRKREAGIGV